APVVEIDQFRADREGLLNKIPEILVFGQFMRGAPVGFCKRFRQIAAPGRLGKRGQKGRSGNRTQGIQESAAVVGSHMCSSLDAQDKEKSDPLPRRRRTL